MHWKFIGTCHYKRFKIPTHHTNTQQTTLASNQTKNRLQTLFSHIQNTNKSTTYIFTIVFHFRHILFLPGLLIYLFFPFHMSEHHLTNGFLCHRSTTVEFTPSWYQKLIFSTKIPFQAQNHTSSKLLSLPRLFPILLWHVYQDFRFLLFSFYHLCPIKWHL